jgi:glycosyltransferase involved in cell wall biosynthesis
VSEAEPEAFAAAIDELLAHEESQHQMGLRARTLAETRLSWSALAKHLDEFYRDLLGERGV